MDADVIVVGAARPGLVATHELTRRGKRVALLDQENAANLGGQAFWSFGGLFLVDSPEQRRVGIKDSFELAWSDPQEALDSLRRKRLEERAQLVGDGAGVGKAADGAAAVVQAQGKARRDRRRLRLGLR